jgi:hypothetical protein
MGRSLDDTAKGSTCSLPRRLHSVRIGLHLLHLYKSFADTGSRGSLEVNKRLSQNVSHIPRMLLVQPYRGDRGSATRPSDDLLIEA